MSDLVERLLAEQILQQDEYSTTTMRRNPDGPEAAARIQALETSLAEAEGRVKDQIVNAIKTHQNFGDEDFGPGLDLAIDIATALETGEWKK